MIILGVVVAVWLGERRWAARGGAPGTVVDVAVWAVPFGLVGGRLYHVITDYQLYFGKDPHIVRVFEVWKGGLGIWGAIAAGALGAYLGCRRRGVSLRAFADAAAPGIALAQALGRWGNWFNQELYGRPTKLPWAVKIDPVHRVSTPDLGTYHPTFLYESLWCVGVALLVIWAEKRFRLAYGRAFALYVAAYTVGRAWIEWLRVDSAHHILGLRLNDWTSLVVFLGAVAYLYYYRDRTEIAAGAVGPAAPEAGAEPAMEAEEEPSAATTDDAATETTGTDPAKAARTPGETAAPATSGAAPGASEDAASDDVAPEGESPDGKATEDKGPEGKATEDKATDGKAAEGGTPASTAAGRTASEDEPSEDAADTAEDGEAPAGGGSARAKAATGAEPGERKS